MKTEEPLAPSNRQRMRGIDTCRGLAAVMVVLVHSASTVSSPKLCGIDPTHGNIMFCVRGVDFFFVLSGFIITYVHWGQLGHKENIPSFLYKRFARVYPLLWAISLPWWILCGMILKIDALPTETWQLADCAITSMLAIPSSIRPFPPVVWTLKHEVFFYLLFVLAIVSPRLGGIGLGFWFAGCLVYALQNDHSMYLLDFLLSCYNIEFMLGVGCAAILRNRRISYPEVYVVVGLIFFAVSAYYFEFREYDQPWVVNGSTLTQIGQFGIASALIVLGIAQLDLNRGLYVPRFAEMLGAASYSIYLVHPMALSVFSRLLKMASNVVPIPPLVFFSIVAICAILTGLCTHYLLEKPLLSFFRERRNELAVK